MCTQHPGKNENLTLAGAFFLAATANQKNDSLSSRRLLVESHHCMAEINHCKSIKRTELFPIRGVQLSNRNSEGTL
jgi:hypothetical protein